MRRLLMLLFVAAGLSLMLPVAAVAADYHVAADGDDLRNSGLQGSPFASVQKAIDAAAPSGGDVYVGPGTFTGAITMRNGVSLFGAGATETTLTVTSGSVITLSGLGSGETISGFTITGGVALRGGGIYCDNSSPVIERNVIIGNTAQMATDPWEYPGGGGVYFYGGAPSILNNVITDNRAVGEDVYGGGLYLFNSSATLRGNTIIGNITESTSGYGYAQGGGMYLRGGSATVSGNLIADNSVSGNSVRGGGIAADGGPFQIVGNTVVRNSALAVGGMGYAEGGGIYLFRSSGAITGNTVSDNVASGDYASGGGILFYAGWDVFTPTISANIVTGNTATGTGSRGTGGGISCEDGSPRVLGNIISGNTASAEYGGEGGGLYCSSFWEDHVSTPIIANNVISSNLADGGEWGGTGGGVRFESSPAVVRNNTIADNRTAGDSPGAGGVAVDDFWGRGRPNIVNVILWGNTGAEISGVGITYSCVDGGAGGDGNIASNPLFADAGAGDFWLLAGSPASDVASPTVAPATDIRGVARPQGSGPDMGAYEHVPPVSVPPVVAADAFTTTEDVPLVVPGTGVLDNDTVLVDDGPLTASVVIGPSHGDLVLDSLGSFTYTPDAEWSGADSFEYAATDARGRSATAVVTITVDAVADAPVLGAIGDRSVDEGAELAFTATASDIDSAAETLTFSLGAGAPAGASIGAATGAFTWTPTEAQGPGSYDITVIVSDGTVRDTEVIVVTVAEVPTSPVLTTIGTKSVDELAALTFTATATDADLPANTLTFSLAAGAPDGSSIDPATGAFSWTPTEAQGPGSYDITVVASDGALEDSETFTVTVAEVSVAPMLGAIGTKSVDEGVELAFTATATDADLPANTLTFSLAAGAPDGSSIDPATGAFSWTPTEAQGPGSYDITVVVSDGALEDSETFTVTVAEVSVAPMLGAIGTKSVDELAALTFAATATDADRPAQTLTFSLGASAPAGASIDPVTGVFTWTPTEAQGPGSYPIEVIVSDGALEDSQVVTVTVREVADPTPPTTESATTRGRSTPPSPAGASVPATEAPVPAVTPTTSESATQNVGASATSGDSEDPDDPAGSTEDSPADTASGFPWWVLGLIAALAGLGLIGWRMRRTQSADADGAAG